MSAAAPALDQFEQATLPRLLITDDHQVLLGALTQTIGNQFWVETASNQEDFLEAINSFTPDLAVLDIGMPGTDGFAMAQRLKERQPSLPIVFLSMHTEPAYIERAAQLGAKAYISKQEPVDELVRKLKAVLNGETLLEPALQGPSTVGPLTARQIEVLRLIASGASAKDIANTLNISVRTAEFHRAAIMQRLQLRSTAQMTRYALTQGLTQ